MVQSNGRALLKRIVCASDGSKLPAAIEFDEFDLPSLKKEDNCHCAAHIFLRFLFCSTLRWYAGPGRMKVLEVPDSFMGVLFFCFLAPRSSIFCAILLFYFFLLADAKMKNDPPLKNPDVGVNFNSFPLLLEIRRLRLYFFICSMLYSFLGGPPAFKHQGRAKITSILIQKT